MAGWALVLWIQVYEARLQVCLLNHEAWGGSGKEDCWRILPYMGMAAIFAMWPQQHCQFTLPHLMDASIEIWAQLALWLLIKTWSHILIVVHGVLARFDKLILGHIPNGKKYVFPQFQGGNSELKEQKKYIMIFPFCDNCTVPQQIVYLQSEF